MRGHGGKAWHWIACQECESIYRREPTPCGTCPAPDHRLNVRNQRLWRCWEVLSLQRPLAFEGIAAIVVDVPLLQLLGCADVDSIYDLHWIDQVMREHWESKRPKPP